MTLFRTGRHTVTIRWGPAPSSGITVDCSCGWSTIVAHARDAEPVADVHLADHRTAASRGFRDD